MADYIDREELLKKEQIFQQYNSAIKDDEYIRAVTVADIEAQPSIDAVEQKHGHWTKEDRCSRCDNPAPIDNRPIHKDITLLKGVTCPYCGAIMDEVTE